MIYRTFARLIRSAQRISERRCRQVWIEWDGNRVALHLAHHTGWRLIARVIGSEVI